MDGKALITKLTESEKYLNTVASGEAALKNQITAAVDVLFEKAVNTTLEEMDIQLLNTAKSGIRVSALEKAGITNILKLSKYSQKGLTAINGIGEQGAKKIYSAIKEIKADVKKTTTIKLSLEKAKRETAAIIKPLYSLLYGGYTEAGKLLNENSLTNASLIKQAKKGMGLNKLFASKTKKEQAQLALEEINALLEGEYGQGYLAIVKQQGEIKRALEKARIEDFEQNSPSYYALLEKIDKRVSTDNSQSLLPDELVEKINATELNLSMLKATLRSYQEFGAKYIICQKRVLLGDEMGLGKTMQAIASMCALGAMGKTHFMVVCPAGVLINWCREITKFSALKAHKIHGNDIEALEKWHNEGGVAVTTYESLSRFELPKGAKIEMLTADEAHYVKNPEAIRTKAIIEVLKKTENVLFMTGTPLENKVEEMVFLLSLINKEISKKAQDLSYLSGAPQFRQVLAPVYLRRTREDVLKELPDLIETEEWVDATSEELSIYRDAVMEDNFMAMRQVSWLGDITSSSKAQALLEICRQAKEDNRKVIIFSFFRNTIAKVCAILGENALEPITGDIPPEKRQQIVDKLKEAPAGTAIVSQVQAGGTGLNVQAASVVIFCEPQIKPSIENQALSRAYRMGQTRSVLVYRLLCEDTVDERMLEILATKQNLFDKFADESVVGEENIKQTEASLAKEIIEKEKARLGAV